MNEDIERSAEEIIQSFIRSTKDLPSVKETYYSQERYNIARQDGPPTKIQDLQEFRERFLSIAPKKDEEGYVKVEVATWVER